MILKIDTNKKTISVEDDVNILELVKFLTENIKNWKEYVLISNHTLPVINPVFPTWPIQNPPYFTTPYYFEKQFEVTC